MCTHWKVSVNCLSHFYTTVCLLNSVTGYTWLNFITLRFLHCFQLLNSRLLTLRLWCNLKVINSKALIYTDTGHNALRCQQHSTLICFLILHSWTGCLRNAWSTGWPSSCIAALEPFQADWLFWYSVSIFCICSSRQEHSSTSCQNQYPFLSNDKAADWFKCQHILYFFDILCH